MIYSFIGSNTILQLAGETKNPQWAMPFALIGTMVFCTMLYFFLQIAFVGAISPQALAAGWSKLHYMGDSGPFTSIMVAMGLTWFVLIIYADAIISPFGAGYVFTASTARVSYGLSEIGFFPTNLKKLTKNGVPFRCILLNYFIGLLLFLPFPGWQKLVSFVVSCFIFSYIIGPLSLMKLRQKEPHVPRPFFLKNTQVVAFLAFYLCNLLIFWTGWQTVSKMMIVLTVGLTFYSFHGYRDNPLCWLKQIKSIWWIFPYFIALAGASYLGTFGGGKNFLPFGWDFIVIASITLPVFYKAIAVDEIDQSASVSSTYN